MTRHDEIGGDDEKISLTRGELKEEIRKEMRHAARRRLLISLVLYLIFFAVMLGTPVLLLAGVAAQSGLYRVPILSAWLYEPPSPTRVVVPLAGSGPDAILASMAAKATYEPVRGIAELTLSEQELTTLIAASVSEASESGTMPFPLDSMQAALLGDGVMELYAVTEREGNRAPVILSVIPEAVDGDLKLRTEDFHIGAFDVPDFLTDLVLDAFAGSVTDSLEQALSGAGALDDIAVEEGKIRVHLMQDQR